MASSSDLGVAKDENLRKRNVNVSLKNMNIKFNEISKTVQSFHPPNLTFYLLAYRLMQFFQHMKDKNWEDMPAMSLLNKRKILHSNRYLWDNEKTMQIQGEV